jgi:hypothetical protein
MAKSFVKFGEYGFWVSDGPLEYWLYFLADEINKLPQAPLWLQEAGESWQLQSTGICAGCVNVGLDTYITTPERRSLFIAMSVEAGRAVQGLLHKEETGHIASHRIKNMPANDVVKLAVQFIRLLKGKVTSTASSREALPNVWQCGIDVSEPIFQESGEDPQTGGQALKRSKDKVINFLGHSPLPQPDEVFTFPKYKLYIREATTAWWRTKQAFLANRPDWSRTRASLTPLLQQYIPRLPVYLLARCPICGGKVSESVDTFSLNGFGWNNRPMEPSGRGWLGVTRLAIRGHRPAITYQDEN